MEARGVEPLSESALTGPSPGAVMFQHSLLAQAHNSAFIVVRLVSRKILDISALESGARLLNTVALMHVLVTFFRGRRQTIYPDLYSTYTLTQRLFPIVS